MIRDTIAATLKSLADEIVSALLAAPEAVRMELAKQLLPDINPYRPISEASKDRRILAFMWNQWRVAEWDTDSFNNRPRPFWRASDLQVTSSRTYQPEWWVDLPAPPSEGKQGE